MSRKTLQSLSPAERGSYSSPSRSRMSSHRKTRRSMSSFDSQSKLLKSYSSRSCSSNYVKPSRQAVENQPRRARRPLRRHSRRCGSSSSRSSHYGHASSSTSRSLYRSSPPFSSYRKSSSRRASPKKFTRRREKSRVYGTMQRHRLSRSRSYRRRTRSRHRRVSSSSSLHYVRPRHHLRPSHSPHHVKRYDHTIKVRGRPIPDPIPLRHPSDGRRGMTLHSTTYGSHRTRPQPAPLSHSFANSSATRRYGPPPLPRRSDLHDFDLHRRHNINTHKRFNERFNIAQDLRPTTPYNHPPMSRRRLLQKSTDQPSMRCPFLLRVFYNIKEHHSVEDLNEFLLHEQNLDFNPPQTIQDQKHEKEISSPDASQQNTENISSCVPESETTTVADPFLTSPKFERLHGSELQLYSWMDTSLRKIVDLVKDVCQEARIRSSKISLKLLHLEEDGVYKPYDLGILHNARPGPDDKRLLLRSKFEIGDVISIAIIRLGGKRIVHPPELPSHANDPDLEQDEMHKCYKDSSMSHEEICDPLKEMNSEDVLQHSLSQENDEAFMDCCEKHEDSVIKSEDHTTVVVDDEGESHTMIDCPVQLSI